MPMLDILTLSLGSLASYLMALARMTLVMTVMDKPPVPVL